MEAEETQKNNLRRVRTLLMLASKRSACNGQDSPKERTRKETEFFKKLFMACDTNGSGTLSIDEVIGMARKHLKIAKRLVSDDQIREFFHAIDEDGGGEVEFTEFLSFIRTKEKNTKINDLVLKQVKRVVRLAMQRQNMTLPELEHRFQNAEKEGIIDTAGGDSSLGPEEMRRFFRKVLDVNDHEAPDRNLVIAFKAMDEDGGGSLDSEEFMDFIREAIQEETTLCPSPKRDGSQQYVPGLLGGMRGALPSRLPRNRPGTTYAGGRVDMPFCANGRDICPRTRHAAAHMPSFLQPLSPARPPREIPVAFLLPTGLPKSANPSPLPSPSHQQLTKSRSAGFFMTSLSGGAPSAPPTPAAAGVLLGGSSPGPPSPTNGSGGGSVVGSALPPLASPLGAGSKDMAERGAYTAVKGMLSHKDADMLNRIEQRLFDAGVDLRGQFHKRS